MKKIIAGSIATMIMLSTSGTANAVPLVGMNGVCANAANLADYISSHYPNVQSIGGVRPDRLPDHPSGHAIDIMVTGNTALGNTIAADIRSQSSTFGVKYILWQVPSHYDHVHVTVY